MEKNNIRTVTFKGSQSAEDLFYCKETGEVYLRQPCDNERVRWCTTSKWSGGYEANGPMRAGMEFHIVDDAGEVLFKEVLEKDWFYGGTIAKKSAPFCYEAKKEVELKVQQTRNLFPYDEWKAWLMKEALSAKYTGFADNWLYDATSMDMQKLETVNILGEKMYLTSQQRVHRVCGKKWTCFELYSEDLTVCMGICGYILDE